jgi:uridine monophosphate synthetase
MRVCGADGAAVCSMQVVAHVPAGIPVLLDVKRGDIATTAEAYAAAAWATGATGATVSPYMGVDAGVLHWHVSIYACRPPC